MTPSRYQWTTYNNNLAMRVGTGYSGSYSLLAPVAMTGMQVGWNNRSILKQLDTEQSTSSDVFLNLDTNQLRTIEGSGPPASIAELRFDGVAVARQRIQMDGRFVFENVRMTTDLRKTEVYIYERSINEKPIKVIDYSQTAASRALPGGELLVRGGVGQQGNPLDKQTAQPGSTVTFGNVLYGLSDRITLETSIQQNSTSGTPEMLAGTVISPGSNWTAALYGASANSHYGTDIRLEGRYRAWNTSYWGTMREANFTAGTPERDINHSFRMALNPIHHIGLQAIGHYEKRGDTLLHNYILPAANWYPLIWLYLSATPNDDKSYRYESGLRIGDATTLHTSYDTNIASVDLLRTVNEHLNFRILEEHALHTGNNVTNLALGWYPRHNSKDYLETVLSRSGNVYGISGSWTRYINVGLRVALQYTYNMNRATSLNISDIIPAGSIPQTQKSIALSLSWDLGWSNNGLFPINRRAITPTRGSIAGSLDIMDGTKLSDSDINNISVMLNGRSLPQSQIDGKFFIGSLPQGVYSLSVDPEKLPIELVLDQKERMVEVKSGAVTGAKIPVYALYSVAGIVTDNTGVGVANVTVVVASRDGKVITRTKTNEFGYYRSEGLRNDTYMITAESVEGKPVSSSTKRLTTIKNDYLFDENLVIKIPSEAGK